MKKLTVIAVVVVSLCLVASMAFAGAMAATVKSVDAKAGTIVVEMHGKTHHLKAEKGVDLSNCKAGDKVEIEVEKNMVKSIKAAEAPAAAAPAPAEKPKASVGC